MALFHTTVVDNQIKALDTIGTASGAVATFDTDRAERLVKCVCEVASGASEINVTACGKNLFDFEGWLSSFHIVPTKVGNSYTLDTTGNSVLYSQPFVFSDTDIQITFNSQRSYPTGSTATNVGFDVLTKDGTVVASRVLSFNGVASKIRLNWSNNGTVTITEPQIEINNQSTTYEQYNGTKLNIPFGETLSGNGSFDVLSGILTRSDDTTKHVDGNVLTAQVGTNNVYADTGDIIDLKFILSVGQAIS